MITAKLLCEFTTNPFGDQQKARELLSEIERRDLSNAELARAEFSFQIAFYFLALLAIEANVDDRSVQRAFLFPLHDRIRAFHAQALLPIGLDQLLASAIERDQIEIALRQGPDGSGRDVGLISQMIATRLTMFDLAGVRRIDGYHDALSRANGRDRFSVLAERVLFDYGARGYHPVVVATVAELLSANYNIASEIVTAGLAALNSRQSESDPAFQPLLLAPGMPNLADKRPIKSYSAGRYQLLLFEDARPLGAKIGIRFRYVLALCDKNERRPACFVTLENSSSISNVLCVFERGGSHSNYGSLAQDLPQALVLHEFLGKGLILLGDRFELGEVEENTFQMLPARRRWWTLFVPAAAQLREQAA
jgi:hypothetical protein